MLFGLQLSLLCLLKVSLTQTRACWALLDPNDWKKMCRPAWQSYHKWIGKQLTQDHGTAWFKLTVYFVVLLKELGDVYMLEEVCQGVIRELNWGSFVFLWNFLLSSSYNARNYCDEAQQTLQTVAFHHNPPDACSHWYSLTFWFTLAAHLCCWHFFPLQMCLEFWQITSGFQIILNFFRLGRNCEIVYFKIFWEYREVYWHTKAECSNCSSEVETKRVFKYSGWAAHCKTDRNVVIFAFYVFLGWQSLP